MDGITYGLVEGFIKEFVKGENLNVCDVGSYDVNGTFKPLFVGHRYIGLDIVEGPNVDIVSKELYHYPFDDESFDIVVSGSTLEHVKDMFSWIKELARIVKKQGFICITCPSIHRNRHPHPVDCWRIYPDGMIYLLGDVAGLEVLRAVRSSIRGASVECLGIGRKK